MEPIEDSLKKGYEPVFVAIDKGYKSGVTPTQDYESFKRNQGTIDVA